MGALVVTAPMVQAKVGATFVHLIEGQPVPAEVDPVQLEQMLAAGQVTKVEVVEPDAEAEAEAEAQGGEPEAKPARARRS